MKDITQKFLDDFQPKVRDQRYQDNRPGIICADGTFISVQASRTHYCLSRENNANPYLKVEVGYPSVQPPKEWKPFCENWEKPTETVYAYVPVYLVDKFLEDHGGIDWKASFIHEFQSHQGHNR